MRVLGVDPGLTRCGLGVVDAAPDRTLSAAAVGVLRSAPDLLPERRLLLIAEGIEAWIAEHRPDVVAVERVFAQQNVRSVTGTSQVAGIAMLAAARAGIPVALHTPSEVKAAVTGSGRAEKAQVQEMVRRILRLSEAPRPADSADALALAVCHIWRGGRPGLAGSAEGLAGAGATSGGVALTAAQRMWAEAERAARRPTTLARRR